ncbi:6982_t:CDS:2 [Paraglomus occultum]|uniref:6982_t:CDS:1 n=1 Tax=Paraglomus occultum TaxID=144539 RepID=A0A9N8W7Z1_9GLOM|nr:6982_t:CDS:2 [Paraglomus occultum]
MINGRKANPNSEEDINYFLNANNKEGKGGWEEFVALLSQPPVIHFKGYGGFVTKKDLENSSEGMETFGLTTCNKPVEIETIVHELAHSIVDTMKLDYDGEEGGGHGKLFYDLMEDIEKMVRETPEFKEFEE